MLTREILKSNTTLSELTDEQINAIAELSKNDENSVIASKTRDIWDSVDNDIKSITGESKPHGVKSYDHFKSILSGWKEKADSSGDYEKLKTDYDNLKKELKSGKVDESIKSQITDLEKQLNDKESTIKSLRNDLGKKDSEWQQKVEAEASKNIDLRFENAFGNSLRSIKFKSNIPDIAIQSTIKAAKEIARSKGIPEFQQDDNGNDVIVFRDKETGLLITNPENLQKPLTAGEVFKSQISDIIDNGNVQKGGGVKPGNGNATKVSLDFNNVRTKVDADKAIRSHLQDAGVKVGTQEFTEQYQEIYNENKVSDLPTK